MSNRFDEMVLDAVADVEEVDEAKNRAAAPKKKTQTTRNVVSISTDETNKTFLIAEPMGKVSWTKRCVAGAASGRLMCVAGRQEAVLWECARGDGKAFLARIGAGGFDPRPAVV